jgi:type IV pilus assembly protein PilW
MRVLKQPGACRKPHQRGVGLIEIMVSVVLGLLVIGGVLSLYLGNRWNYRTHQQLGRIQENARFAFELMMRETRDAGLLPCGSPLTANVIRVANAVPWWADTDAGIVHGFDETDASSKFNDIFPTAAMAAQRKSSTDALLLLRPASTEGKYGRILTHDPATNTFTLGTAVDSSALLQLSAAGTSPTYTAAGLNVTDKLGTPNAATQAAVVKQFANGATLVPWEPAFWYVGANSRGGTSLYRITISQGVRADTVEMIPDVSNMQIDYLRSDANGVEENWVSGPTVNFGWASGTNPIVAVRARITFVGDGSTIDGTPLTRTLVAVATLRNGTP